MAMKEVVRYSKCFVCGDENPIGLKARFYQDGDHVTSSLVALSEFEGYRGIYHGGIIATMLDEVMIKSVLAMGIFAVTAEISVRYKSPVLIGAQLRFSGKIKSQKGRVFSTEGEAADDQGIVYATASGKYVQADGDLKERLKISVE